MVCPEGTKLTHKSGDTHYCKPNPPVCDGKGKLKSGQEIWKKAHNMWKTKDGKHVYCSVECPKGTKLTHKSGDTHYCKPEHKICSYSDACNKKRITAPAGGLLKDSCRRVYKVSSSCKLSYHGKW